MAPGIQHKSVAPNTILKHAASFGPLIHFPATNDTAVAAAQTPTLGTAILLNGTGVLPVVGSTTACYFAIPAPITFTCAAAADTFTCAIVGLDHYGLPQTATMVKSQTTTRTQRDTTGAMWSRIDSIIFSAYTSGGTITCGFRVAGADTTPTTETGANSVFRLPFPLRLLFATDLLGIFVLNGGGGTFAAGAGQGAMLRSTIASFTVNNPGATGNPGTYFGYVSGCTTQPTAPMTFVPVFSPGYVGNVSGAATIGWPRY